MRVLLIQPPYDLFEDDERQAMPPLGLAYVAAVLERAGHEVGILDCVVEGFHRLARLGDDRRRHGLDGPDLMRRIAAFRPEVVGVSSLFSAQSAAAHHVCALVKQLDPGIATVMGGAHPSAVPEEVLADANVDFAAVGEGEITLLRLVETLGRGERLPAEVDGLAFRGADGVVFRRPSSHLADLDLLPLPARHLLPMKRYFEYRSPHGTVVRRHPCTNMITSRGCPARCSFCSIHTVWGRRFRWHSAERVVQEIEALAGDYGVREVQFEDDNLTLNKPRIRRICEMIIDRRIDLTWTTPNGVATWALDEKLLELMRRAGCYHIAVAVESGCQEVLDDLIHKPLDLRRVPPIVRAARRLGMGVSAFFVVGFPGETRDQIGRTIDYAMNLGADHVHFFTATPYPGTALYRECLDKGLLRLPVDYTSLRVGRPAFGSSDWTADELAELTRAAQARFYRRTAVRRPVRFIATVARKFAREPRVTMHKAWRTLFVGDSARKPPAPKLVAGAGIPRTRLDEEIDSLVAAAGGSAEPETIAKAPAPRPETHDPSRQD